jgi:antitoxin component YwqK of YwqJK toxin-antitoxin module
MKKLMLMAALMLGVVATAQEVQPTVKTLSNDLVEVTYYYSNGEVSQIGTFKDNKRHGEWTSFSMEGKKTAEAEYQNGQKTGKWFFWSDNKLTEVDYSNNMVVAVNTWTNKNPVATNNP